MLSQFNRSSRISQHFFIELILNIDCEDIFHYLNIDDNKFESHYQKFVILQELLTIFGLIYIGGKKIITDDIFWETNIHINEKMYASEFEGLLCKNISE